DNAAAVDDPQAREIQHLAFMARGRIHYEREEWAEAFDSYQYVPRTSPHFDQALYEQTWTHVRQNEPRLALRLISILELLRPDSLFIPEAQRLKGDLSKDIGEYEDALATYEELLQEFEPVLKELDLMVEGQPDRLAYFKELVAQDTLGQAQYLPRSASQWVQPDGQMVRSEEHTSE